MSAATRPGDSVLCDAALDDRLHDDGYAAVPLWSDAQVQRLVDGFWSVVEPSGSGIQLDYLRHDPALKRRLADVVEPLWDEVCDEVFVEHRPLYSSFVVKFPGAGSQMFLHRDIGIEDERHGSAYSVWVPLEDVSAELGNGVLEVVPRSHHIDHGAFGLAGPILFAPYLDAMQRLARPVPLRAGTGLVYDARLVHGSPPNRTDHPRLAVGCLVARRGVPPIHVMATGRRSRSIHLIDRDFFVDHHAGEVVAHGMPQRWPAVEHFEDDTVLEPATLAAALGVAHVPPPRVVVPADVQGGPSLAEATIVAGRFDPAIASRHDVTVTAADLADRGAAAACGARIVGRAAAVRVRDGWRRRRVPAELVEPVRAALPRSVRRALLVVLEPGARLALPPGPEEATGCIAVIDAPQVNAGLRVADRFGALEPGAVAILPPGVMELWNDGPGRAVVVVADRPW